jgi:SAM-dependent methyltransferase
LKRRDVKGAGGYDAFYETFDSPLMRRVRLEAYGQDIGQHSWATAEEVTEHIARLGLTAPSRLLDLGCGPGGPLTFIVSRVSCRASGLDVSPAAIDSARARVASLGLDRLIELSVADSNEALPFEASSFSAVIAIDVVLHLRDRAAVFREVARLLAPGGRFLFTDAAVLESPVSSVEVQRRSIHGLTHFAPVGFNERSLAEAGLQLLEREDLTPNLLAQASGRLAARRAHRAALEEADGAANFESQLTYLETVIDLARRGSVRRVLYLAQPNSA